MQMKIIAMKQVMGIFVLRTLMSTLRPRPVHTLKWVPSVKFGKLDFAAGKDERNTEITVQIFLTFLRVMLQIMNQF